MKQVTGRVGAVRTAADPTLPPGRGGGLPGHAAGNQPAGRTQRGGLTGHTGTFTAIDGSSSTWVLGPASVSGASTFGSTLHMPFFGNVDLPMVWGNPWSLTVGLLAQTNRSADASLMASAKLIDVQLFAAPTTASTTSRSAAPRAPTT